MASRDDLLDHHTHKNDGVGTAVRVFYTLNEAANLGPTKAQIQRNSKLLGLLVERLVESGALTADDVDSLLLSTLDLGA